MCKLTAPRNLKLVPLWTSEKQPEWTALAHVMLYDDAHEKIIINIIT
jgi:hypothetical protein